MEHFDLTIIGGGVGGLATANSASQLGAKVALVEKEQLGGSSHYGCVPMKTLARSAKLISLMQRAEDVGLNRVNVNFEFKKVMDHMRAIKNRIAGHDSPDRLKKMGVELFFGQGAFKDPHTFLLNGIAIKSKKFLISTGSRPITLPIPGLNKINFLNNINILNINELPISLIVLGAGPVGMEFAHIFSRFGSRVTIIEKADQILPREDRELTYMLEGILKKDGIEIVTGANTKKVELSGDKKIIKVVCNDRKKMFEADELLVAIGRAPNIKNLNLEKIGVQATHKGIIVDDTMKTTVSNIWACGDVTGLFPFTHMAEYEAGLVVANALFPFVRKKMDKRAVPWTIFTDPDLAHVGLTEDEARGKGNINVCRLPFSGYARAVINGNSDGLIKLICAKKGKILGAHILGTGAGDMLNEYVFAMKNGLPLHKIRRATSN